MQIGTFSRVYGFSGTCVSFLNSRGLGERGGAPICDWLWGHFGVILSVISRSTFRLEVAWGLDGGCLGVVARVSTESLQSLYRASGGVVTGCGAI